MHPKEKQARAIVAQRPTYDLVTDFENTESMEITPEVALVRGWIMDELEARDPEAFNAWLDANVASPRDFYTCTGDN